MSRSTTTALAPFIARLLRRWTGDRITARKLFPLFEKLGIHVTRAHFYQPIPVLSELRPNLWDQPSQAAGIDFRADAQLALVGELAAYAHEVDAIAESGDGFHFNNGLFEGVDAYALYAMVRHVRPSLVIEVGAGWSSLLTDRALAKNGAGTLRCIEPYPEPWLKGSFEVIRSRAEDLGVAAFEELKANDILFIDSSHVVKIGSDVNFLILEVLPRLAPGVIVHVHDIFLPYEYPKRWVLEEHIFWNEQYLLQAFLTFNREFEVLLANHYLEQNHQHALQAAFPRSPWWGGGSFWMRRV